MNPNEERDKDWWAESEYQRLPERLEDRDEAVVDASVLKAREASGIDVTELEWAHPKVVLVEDHAGAQWRRSAPNSWVMVVSVTPLVGPPFVDVSYAPPTAASDQLQKYYGPIRIVAVMDPSGELDFG